MMVTADASSPPPKPIPISPLSSVGSIDEISFAGAFDLLEDVKTRLHEDDENNSTGTTTKPMKILFLSSDTGGGHRASAESLANQFLIHYPGSTYDLLDVWKDDGIWPYSTLVETYKHFSANPSHWRFFYHVSNSSFIGPALTWHSTFSCEHKIRRRIESYDPDVIISVHPTMQHAPIRACRKFAQAQKKHIPFFTVVTDLASAHANWFESGVDKVYLASDSLYDLAKTKAGIPPQNIFKTGLPIRHDFAVQAQQLGDRNSPAGQAYQEHVKQTLGLSDMKPMILVMGGGEGVGGLDSIINELYTSLTLGGVDATICVVCGRNEKLKDDLQVRDWDAVLYGEYRQDSSDLFCNPSSLEQPAHPKLLLQQQEQPTPEAAGHEEKKDDDGLIGDSMRGNVTVQGLGFVTRMAEYMVAATVLVTKAGPGTIAEASAVGLPVLLTSFLPGQEAGNVDFVLDNGFGDFCQDPIQIGQTVSQWLQNQSSLDKMSVKARQTGHPDAAAEIVLDIGSATQEWMDSNEKEQQQQDLSSSSSSSSFAMVDGISEFIVD